MAQSSLYPGLLLTFIIAVAARVVHALPFAPFTIGDRHPVDAMIVAIVIGIVVRNTIGLGTQTPNGIRFSVKKVLPFAIVLMGAKLDFFDILRISGKGLVISVASVVVALSLTIWLCRKTNVGMKLGILIGVGTAICGGTAIAVVAPVIEADDDDTAFAVTAITLFGLLAIVVFPLIGTALSMSQTEFGMWAGVSIHATPQVMAAGFSYGNEAGDVAVIVKLVRVLLLAPLVVAIGAWYAREKRKQQQAHVTSPTSLTKLFPPFILGFLVLAFANTLNVLPDFTVHLRDSILWPKQSVPLSMAKAATGCSSFLINIAMAGIGLGVHLKKLAKIGPKALYVGLFAAIVLSVFCLTALRLAA
jgi:uncharacterized integral membrane protein (TIGR00698 family)